MFVVLITIQLAVESKLIHRRSIYDLLLYWERISFIAITIDNGLYIIAAVRIIC